MTRVLDTRQLLAFCTVARRRSFTLAAKDLNLSQSAISHAMRALEEELGTRLLERGARSVALTPGGERLVTHAEAVLRELDAARASVRLSSDWEHAALRVGVSAAVCQHILPVVLREFRESFPKCAIQVEPGDQAQQFELLLSGRIDLALALRPLGEAPAEVSLVPLFDDELCFFVSPRHPWAGLRSVPPAEIASQPVVLYNRGTYTSELVRRYFASAGIELGNVIELGSMAAIKETARLGLGAGIFATWVATGEAADGALIAVPLGAAPLRRTWCAAFRKAHRPAMAEQTFTGLCQSVAENLGFSTGRTLAEKRAA